MVLMPDPIFRAVDALKDDESFIILLTPQGHVYKQKDAYELKNKKHLIIICGHYEALMRELEVLLM